MGDAGDRIRALATRIGPASLTGHLEVNQVYAAYQHFREELKHTSGGRVYYLQGPLFEQATRYLQEIADSVLDGDMRATMFDVMKQLNTQVEINAPVTLGNLRMSGHPFVTEGGAIVHDQPPRQRRLSEEELKALSRARGGHPYGNRGRRG